VLDSFLVGVYVIAPIIVTGIMYALMWGVLCLVRFIPMVGRKHRHADWDRMNR
jgi:predicted PurR-regulated permease PerM